MKACADTGHAQGSFLENQGKRHVLNGTPLVKGSTSCGSISVCTSVDFHAQHAASKASQVLDTGEVIT